MSWSVTEVGKAAAVRKSIADQFARGGKCMEPEESVRLQAAAAMDQALGAQDPDVVVRASANGSQGFKDYQTSTGPFNSMSMSIEVIHGFVG
jgi:hypothetical protein